MCWVENNYWPSGNPTAINGGEGHHSTWTVKKYEKCPKCGKYSFEVN